MHLNQKEGVSSFYNFFEFGDGYKESPESPPKRKKAEKVTERRVFLNAEGKLHNPSGPAVLYPNGTREWFVDGMPHRLDGPAISRKNGRQEWWLNGLRHRTDGPAIILKNGWKEWWVNGIRHNENGPAIILNTGCTIWYWNGEVHNSYGPAVTRNDGSFHWYRRGICIDDAMEKWMKDRDIPSYPWDDDAQTQFLLASPLTYQDS